MHLKCSGQPIIQYGLFSNLTKMMFFISSVILLLEILSPALLTDDILQIDTLHVSGFRPLPIKNVIEPSSNVLICINY